MGAVAEARRMGFVLLDAAAAAILITAIVVSVTVPSRTVVAGRERTDARIATEATVIGPNVIGPTCVDEENQPADCYRLVSRTLDRRIPLRAAIAGLGLTLAFAIAGSTRLATARRPRRGAAR